MYNHLFGILFLFSIFCTAQTNTGADTPWITYEAEDMLTNGEILDPSFNPFNVQVESSGQQCVKLNSQNHYLKFIARNDANSLVIRYSLPDAEDGGGSTSSLVIFRNGIEKKKVSISSKYSWLYGLYPFTNNPKAEKPRNFYDEVRIKELSIFTGDTILIRTVSQRAKEPTYTIIDLVDLETVQPPIKAPQNSLAITDKKFFDGNSSEDYTRALRNCIVEAEKTGKEVWIPSGTYKITGDIIIPSDVHIKGAGMWHSKLVGDDLLYTHADRRVRLKGQGNNIHLSDFSITGKLTYRNDNEPNDGIVGSFGENSSISRIWIEHTKAGIWVDNSTNLRVEGCRFRNTIADGINFCVGMTESVIKECSARGTGDDCFAIWPATFTDQKYKPGKNLITNCTAELPFLANGVAVYGGESNQVRNCLFKNISTGSAILISTTFPTTDQNHNNNFSGITTVQNCKVISSGGFDHTWGWRAAVQICLDRHDISGIRMKDIEILNSLSKGLNVVSHKTDSKKVLSNSSFENVQIHCQYIAGKDDGSLWYPEEEYKSLIPRSEIIERISLH